MHNQSKFINNSRMALIYKNMDKQNPEKMKAMISWAKNPRKQLQNGEIL